MHDYFMNYRWGLLFLRNLLKFYVSIWNLKLNNIIQCLSRCHQYNIIVIICTISYAIGYKDENN